MKTGELFKSTNKLGDSYIYELVEFDFQDNSREIILREYTTGELMGVEAEWFRQRKIEVLEYARQI